MLIIKWGRIIMNNYDFSGWATRNNLKCSDGRIILRDAFKHNDGNTVPLVWNHQHATADNILGHATLENREEGVYTYCTFNETEAGKNAKLLVEHGDVSALSIYANQLQQQGSNVKHGVIREVSLVLAGANPGAFIDSVIKHDEESSDEAVIYTGESLEHSASGPEKKDEEKKEEGEDKELEKVDKELEHAEDGKTVQDVFDTLSEEQKNVVYALIGQAIDEQSQNEDDNTKNNKNNGGDDTMKHNLFDKETKEAKGDVLTHAEMETIITDAKRYGSLKESALQHGITDIEFLFPEAKTINSTPDFIKRDTGWVGNVMSGVHNTPFSRIKSMHADITGEEARALGYIKGKLKKEEVFSLLKRTTDPQTVYKKQKLHRDDVIDITDFDVVAWLKAEMRVMLDEEIARAILIGDGRLSSSDDKIQETHIRPVWTDSELYTINQLLTFKAADSVDARAKAFIRSAVKARKDYKGSGQPNLYCTEDILTDCLLLEDTTGRIIYDSVQKLATAMRVKEIITVPVMEGAKRTVETKERTLMGLVVNLADYNVGADKGGAINMFDDFDIDYNAQKYLIETRCSGALTKPYAAIAIESVEEVVVQG
jgi:hypothetical protein